MAEYVAIPSNVKLQVYGNVLEEQFFLMKTSASFLYASFYHGSCKVNLFSPWKASKLIVPCLRVLNGSPKEDNIFRHCSLSALGLGSCRGQVLAGLILLGSSLMMHKRSSSMLNWSEKSSSSGRQGRIVGEISLWFDKKDGYYNGGLCILYGVAIIMYLELISVGSSLSNEMNNLGVCEDQFSLHTLRSQLIVESNRGEAENFSWCKKLSFRRSGPVSSSLCFVVISHISAPVKRTKELRALTAWRYYFSPFLELADITMLFCKKGNC
ncbi:hypothetical protein Pfo_006544 [Paulownia fortunei]|nr:hypothetical protein Pfo_006544 [Paulownia fortunei]